jgi:hypothetical protein
MRMRCILAGAKVDVVMWPVTGPWVSVHDVQLSIH